MGDNSAKSRKGTGMRKGHAPTARAPQRRRRPRFLIRGAPFLSIHNSSVFWLVENHPLD